MDTIRAVFDKHGKIHARVSSPQGSCQVVTPKSNALFIGRKVVL